MYGQSMDASTFDGSANNPNTYLESLVSLPVLLLYCNQLTVWVLTEQDSTGGDVQYFVYKQIHDPAYRNTQLVSHNFLLPDALWHPLL